MSFQISAESVQANFLETRQTEASALGLALDLIDRGYWAVEIRDSETDENAFEGFVLAYSTTRSSASKNRLS